VVQRLAQIARRSATQKHDVFMKVGASGTVSSSFFYCFAGSSANLGGRDELQPCVDHFRAGNGNDGGASGPLTPFDRPSYAAEVGRTAAWAMTGTPAPVDRESAAITPRFALVNYGTNDMNLGTTHRSALFPFLEDLAALLDHLEGAGIVPVVTGLNPRADDPAAARWVPTYALVTRALAEARQVPFIDLHAAVRGLPDQGLLADGIHGNVYVDGTAQPCVFTPEGLQWNYNVRNLLTIETLDALVGPLLLGAVPPDATVPPPAGSGAPVDPVVVDRLPFTHAADTAALAGSAFGGYPACDAGQDESGPEVVYRLDLPADARLRVVVLDRGAVDVDLHLLGAAPDPGTCVARHDRILERTVPAGTHHVVVDTYVPADGVPRAGAYLLVILECEADDPDCDG
jgi:hypothetical protein